MNKRKTVALGLALSAAFAVTSAARADEWDLGNDSDVGVSTDNALFHGSSQVHDLGSPGSGIDVDWFKATSRPFSSYQVVIDGMSGDLGTPDVGRFANNGTTGVQFAALDSEGVLSMSWYNSLPSPAVEAIRVLSTECGSACTASDRYRIRYYDTTYTIPRFNNTGTQSTVLLIGNAIEQSCFAVLLFLRADGSLIYSLGFSLQAGELRVLPPAFQPANQSGSVRVAHTCGYGGLAGKAVSVEPSTGFTFDTPLVPRPH